MSRRAAISSLLFLGFLVISHASPVFACTEYACDEKKGDEGAYLSCLQDKTACLQNKIAEVGKEKNTLTTTIAIFSNKISLQEVKISQTLAEVAKLEKDVDLLGQRIDTLDFSLDQLTGMLLARIRHQYKRQQEEVPFLVTVQQGTGKTTLRDRYVTQAGEQTAEIMHLAESQKQIYDQQKTQKELKQQELEEKKVLLQKQQQELNAQKASQQKLLEVTKNNEKTYQQLLQNAQAEIAALKKFSSSKGKGTVSPQNSPDGWYYSQRDERWAAMKIGNSNESILDVGCLISSTAMIKKKFGEDASPVSIASNANNFWLNTAYMSKPWPTPSGYHYQSTSFSSAELDQKLAENPVIAKLSAGPYGTHFIVIKEKKDGRYVMHDPWEGFDKNFNDYYSLNQIVQINYLVKN